jgi:hypothetical protein
MKVRSKTRTSMFNLEKKSPTGEVELGDTWSGRAYETQ